MNEVIEFENIKIEDVIYEIRGKQVMLDSDLAKLYQCKNGTKTINQAVKRHIDRFLSDFYFQLTSMEYNSIVRSQVGTLELKQGQYSKYLPYVFTEQGVAMLSSVIRTEVASRVNVNIMRAFVSQRHYLLNNQLEQKYINNIVLENTQKIKEHDNSIKLLHELFDDLRVDKKINALYLMVVSYTGLVRLAAATACGASFLSGPSQGATFTSTTTVGAARL